MSAFSVTMAQRTYVLVTAVSHYDAGEGNDLPMVDDDAFNVYKIFKKQPKTSVGILTSKHVTNANIERKLEAIVKVARPEDRIIFYFAGHGEQDGCFYTNGGHKFSYVDLSTILSKANTKNVFCIIEACYSGSSAEAANKTFGKEHPWITYIVSSRADETSKATGVIQHGIFSNAVCKGLRGAGDQNADRKVTVQELFDYVYKDVTGHTEFSETMQHPQLIGPADMFDKVIINWNR